MIIQFREIATPAKAISFNSHRFHRHRRYKYHLQHPHRGEQHQSGGKLDKHEVASTECNNNIAPPPFNATLPQKSKKQPGLIAI